MLILLIITDGANSGQTTSVEHFDQDLQALLSVTGHNMYYNNFMYKLVGIIIIIIIIIIYSMPWV